MTLTITESPKEHLIKSFPASKKAMAQRSFTDIEYSKRHKQSKRAKFLERMKQVIPWEERYALISPHYYKGLAKNASATA